MNISFESINYFDGTIIINELKTLPILTKKELPQIDRKELLRVKYGENTLSVIIDFTRIENNSVRIEILINSKEEKIIQKNDLTNIFNEIQFAIYKIIKVAKWCPQVFCFHWLEPGDYAAPGMYNSPEEGLKKMKLIKKNQCGYRFGKCSRDIDLKGEATGLHDSYEPCEPFLKKKGLPDLYFMEK